MRQYLIKQNRPYNATDLQANLKSKHNVGKTAVTKALASLASKGEIVEKEYGKQKIYGPKQVCLCFLVEGPAGTFATHSLRRPSMLLSWRLSKKRLPPCVQRPRNYQKSARRYWLVGLRVPC